MRSGKKRKTIALSVAFTVVAAATIWTLGFTLKFSLERHIIPPYPAKYASLRQILDYYKRELASQGMEVEIRVLSETGYDEPRVVTGLAGNAYLFLFGISDVFDTRFECGWRRVITICGVGSKSKNTGRAT